MPEGLRRRPWLAAAPPTPSRTTPSRSRSRRRLVTLGAPLLAALICIWLLSRGRGSEIDDDGHEERFAVSAEPLPVYESDDSINFSNHPVSDHRPVGQFSVSPRRAFRRKPAVAMCVATARHAYDTAASPQRRTTGQSCSCRHIVLSQVRVCNRGDGARNQSFANPDSKGTSSTIIRHKPTAWHCCGV